MKPENMNRNLCVCYYGTKDNRKTINKIHAVWNKTFDINCVTYYSEFSSLNLYLNLWRCATNRRNEELKTKKKFQTILGINTDDNELTSMLTDIQLFHLVIKPSILMETNDDVLYYARGQFDDQTYKTHIDPSIFYANSVVFDIASNFGLVLPSLRKKKDAIDDEIFFYYLKTHRIKTECINYENRGLFKRST